MITRQQLSARIAANLQDHKDELRAFWMRSAPVRHFYLDDLLPVEWAEACYEAMPDPGTLMLRNTIKERKHVGIDIDHYKPLVGDILFAFQDAAVLSIVSEITEIAPLTADDSLYGSGISMMLEGDFLLPHLDNSHDGDGKLYRVLNALYYITPGWPADKGGNLELWDSHTEHNTEIHSRFNRLVMMETNTHSIHSVNKVIMPGTRACVSNYYFSPVPVNEPAYVHKTTFFARPEDDIIKKMRLTVEGKAKNILSGFFNNKTSRTKHRRK